jgi:hypothetical protein
MQQGNGNGRKEGQTREAGRVEKGKRIKHSNETLMCKGIILAGKRGRNRSTLD